MENLGTAHKVGKIHLPAEDNIKSPLFLGLDVNTKYMVQNSDFTFLDSLFGVC